MKKLAFALIAILFLGSLFLGFRAASHMSDLVQSPHSTDEKLPAETQQNYLLFHVSSLTDDSPFLISIWGLIVNFSDSPRLVFIALHPAANNETTSKFSSAFRLTRDGSLMKSMIDKLEREYDIETNGYILVDNFAVSSLEAWMGGRSVILPQQEPDTTSEYQSILANGESFFNGICQQVNLNGIDSVEQKIQWKDLLPEHFFTNLSFEDLMLAVDTLANVKKIESCEVFTN